MAKINLLPWRDELREKRKKEFIAICIGAAFVGALAVTSSWFYYDHKLEDQEQANQLIVSTNQNLDVQLKSLEGLQEQLKDEENRGAAAFLEALDRPQAPEGMCSRR